MAVRQALSGDRMAAYSLPADLTSTDALARYLWNGALCVAFHPSLHALEVSFRNNLFGASHEHVSLAGRNLGPFRCWLDATPSFLYPQEKAAVQKAISRINLPPHKCNSARLVAKLGFGFWTGLLHSPYDHSRTDGPRMWPALLPKVFPHLPKEVRTRAGVLAAFNDIRDFRNRIAHHEPIWDRDPVRRYDEITTALSWMYPGMARAIRLCSDVKVTYQSGPAQFRTLAERLLGLES